MPTQGDQGQPESFEMRNRGDSPNENTRAQRKWVVIVSVMAIVILLLIGVITAMFMVMFKNEGVSSTDASKMYKRASSIKKIP